MQGEELSFVAGTRIAHSLSDRQQSFIDAYPALFRAGYQVAYRLMGEREDARDIAQEACIRACQRWNRLSEGGYATPWVVRVSTNLSIDRWRHLQRTERHRPPPPSVVAPTDALRIDLHRALATLSRRQREVLVLRYIADLSEHDVARELHCTLGTVKQHAARGLAALRAFLDNDEWRF